MIFTISIHQLDLTLSYFAITFRNGALRGGMSEGHHINSYVFLNNNIDKWIRGETLVHTDPSSILVAYDSFKNGSYISTFFDTPEKLILTSDSDSVLIGFGSYLNTTAIVPSKSENWPDFLETHDKIPDSLFIDKNVIAVSPYTDSVYFATTTPYLYKSIDYGKSYTLVDTLNSWDYDNQIYFDQDSTHMYAITPNGIIRSDEFGEPGSWRLQEIESLYDGEKFLSIDSSVSGNLFISDSTSILFSENYGDSFSELLSFEHQITGLYKKPDSDILYVLTKEELLEVNTQTKETTSLKTIPVSNELEPSEIPSQITLEQNYPNPFNPSTVISYQLAGNSLVRLEVFDVTGRKVAVLVDGD